jgi:hypothetical protein
MCREEVEMLFALRRSTLAAAMVCSLLAFASSARAECTKDTDCKGDRVCNAGACTDPRPTTALPPLQAPSGEGTPPPAAAAVEVWPPPPPPSGPPASEPPADQVEMDATVMQPRSPAMRTAGIVLMTAGAVSVVATTVFLVEAIQARHRVDDECVGHLCESAGASDLNRASMLSGLTTVGVLVSAGFLGSGIPLFFVGKHEVPVKKAAAWWVPEKVNTGPGRVSVTFRF